MNQTGYKCPKCGDSNYESDEFRTVSAIFSTIFDGQIKNSPLLAVSNVYILKFIRQVSSQLENIFDFFTN
ncbi:zinc ribbon domain-containing protein [Labilibaculum manganireducens]|uniref:Uncharacterized protein n=1 Tax=Labilibaculum manganireducens TaxID=1940525 RepID=A0A2N3HTT3_9BACT|nr:hypothetical protein BZG01_19300 [Labilibaculum manganireducens]